MKFLTTFQTADFLDTLVSLAVAFVLGTLIGAERQYRQRTAGLRTNVLVAVGAAAFVDLAMHLSGADGGVRVIAYVVSGIGFLGAGVIMKEGMDISGLKAVALTAFVLAGNTLLRPLVNAINRIPIDEKASEATYYFKLAVTAHALPSMRDRLVEQLEAANYPVGDVNVVEIGDGQLEIVATLVPTAVDPNELNAVALDLQKQSGVRHATWEVSTRD
jgi:putative Mg2+ transporter-C (MgtC) family protein